MAATYLTVEADAQELQADFRSRALIASVAVAITAATSALLAERDAPLVFEALTRGLRAWVLLSATTMFAVTGIVALWKRA
ncbi:MAG: cytochrome d ubiquinol oxidase subunit II, partial [Gemmatimonadaceae bacterium]